MRVVRSKKRQEEHREARFSAWKMSFARLAKKEPIEYQRNQQLSVQIWRKILERGQRALCYRLIFLDGHPPSRFLTRKALERQLQDLRSAYLNHISRKSRLFPISLSLFLSSAIPLSVFSLRLIILRSFLWARKPAKLFLIPDPRTPWAICEDSRGKSSFTPGPDSGAYAGSLVSSSFRVEFHLGW